MKIKLINTTFTILQMFSNPKSIKKLGFVFGIELPYKEIGRKQAQFSRTKLLLNKVLLHINCRGPKRCSIMNLLSSKILSTKSPDLILWPLSVLYFVIVKFSCHMVFYSYSFIISSLFFSSNHRSDS